MKSERIVRVVAIVSVGLNLLLAGVILGRMAGPEVGMKRVDPMIGVRRLLHELPESRARALAPHYRRYFSTLRPRFRELRGVQDELKDAMLTEPLDRAALGEALNSFQARFSDSQRAARDAFVELAAAMTLEERRQLVTAMNEPPRRGERPQPGRPPHDHLPPPGGPVPHEPPPDGPPP